MVMEHHRMRCHQGICIKAITSAFVTCRSLSRYLPGGHRKCTSQNLTCISAVQIYGQKLLIKESQWILNNPLPESVICNTSCQNLSLVVSVFNCNSSTQKKI